MPSPISRMTFFAFPPSIAPLLASTVGLHRRRRHGRHESRPRARRPNGSILSLPLFSKRAPDVRGESRQGRRQRGLRLGERAVTIRDVARSSVGRATARVVSRPRRPPRGRGRPGTRPRWRRTRKIGETHAAAPSRPRRGQVTDGRATLACRRAVVKGVTGRRRTPVRRSDRPGGRVCRPHDEDR